MEYILSFVVASIVMGVLDFIWLVYLSRKFYADALGDLILKKPRMTPAILFYFIYLVGLIFFVIHPSLSAGSVSTALASGALFGFVAYSTYDLTNLATINGFKTKIVVIDLIWGTFLTATTATITYLLVSLWT